MVSERWYACMVVEEKCMSLRMCVQVFLFVFYKIFMPVRQAYHIYLRFLSTRYMRPLMRVMGKLIQARI